MLTDKIEQVTADIPYLEHINFRSMYCTVFKIERGQIHGNRIYRLYLLH